MQLTTTGFSVMSLILLCRKGRVALLSLTLWLGHLTASAQCTYTPTNITVTGISEPFAGIVNGVYAPSGTANGAPQWAGPNRRLLKWTNNRWEIGIQINEETYSTHVYNTGGSITQLPCTGWTSSDGYGTPTLSGGCGSLATPTSIPLTVTPTSATFIAGQVVTLTTTATSATWSTGATGASISFNPTSTTTISVSGLTGTCPGSATISLTRSASTVVPKAAVSFDGTNDYVESSTATGISGTSNRTIEAWIKTSQTTGQGVIVDQGLTQTGQRFTLNVLSGALRIEIQGGGLNGGNVADGNWHHVAVTYNNADATPYRLYIDGVLSASGTIAATLNTADSKLVIGQKVDLSSPFNGSIDEVRVWNRALSSTEIASKYLCELGTGETGLVAYYKFNEAVPNGNNGGFVTVRDASGSNNPGLLSNFGLTGTTSNWVAPAITCGEDSPPTVIITATPSSTAAIGNSVTLTASGATSYTWSTGATSTSIVVAPTTSSSNYSVTGLTGSRSGTATATVTITVVNSIRVSGVLGTNNCTVSVSFVGTGRAFQILGPSYQALGIFRTTVVENPLTASNIKQPGNYTIKVYQNTGLPIEVPFVVTGTACP